MTNYFTDTGLFQGETVYETLEPVADKMLATVIAECQIPLVGDGSGRVIMELGYGMTDDHTTVGAGLSGDQASEFLGLRTLTGRCVVHQLVPANQYATFKMTAFASGSIKGVLIRMSILRVPV